MDGVGSGHRQDGVDRRMEIVSGKGHGVGEGRIYATRPCSPARASDAEMKRKKRMVKYQAYAVEGKVKASMREGFRWIKSKCSQIVHGY